MLTEVTATQTRVTRYAFDALNRLSSAQDPDGNTTSYSYDKVGNRVGMAHENGIKSSYIYDELNRLTSLNHTDASNVTLKKFDYTLSANGKRTKIEEANGRTTDYTYDALYRLTGESIFDPANASHNASYTYNRVGNRMFEVVNGVSTQYTYNNNDWLLQSGGTAYTYDANGSATTETLDGGVTTYTYNAKNKLTSQNKASVNTVYLYNADGIRIGQGNSTDQTLYTLDNNRSYAQVITEVKNGAEEVNYTYGDDLVSQKRSSVISAYHYDGLGSTRALSNQTGSMTDTYDYDAFGESLNRTGTTENNYLFTGEQFDSNLDQYYLRARYYDQGVGRFTQMDTWMGNNSDPVTLHKYLYGNVDPVNMVDPTGNFAGFGGFSATSSIQGILATTAITGIGLSSLANFSTTTADGGFSDRQRGFSILAAMAGAGSKLLGLVTSKVSENSDGRVVLFHGSSVSSLVALLNGAPLAAATALEQKFPGEGTMLGFYLTPDLVAAEFFGARRGGGVIQFTFTNAAFQAVRAGSQVQPIPPIGSSAQSPGVEIIVRPITFPLFDSLRKSGQITATPAGG